MAICVHCDRPIRLAEQLRIDGGSDLVSMETCAVTGRACEPVQATKMSQRIARANSARRRGKK